MMTPEQKPGLIENAQQGPAFDHAGEIDKMVQAMPQEMRKPFENIVEAGKRVLYGPDTRQMVMDFMNNNAPLEDKLGTGIANLIVMLDNKANGSLPKETLIPAGTVLLFDFIDVLKETGENITNEQIAKAYQFMFYGIFQGYGMESDKLDQVFSHMAQQHGDQENPQEDAAPNEEADPQQPGDVETLEENAAPDEEDDSYLKKGR